jgi:histidine triad (HIT) family protein
MAEQEMTEEQVKALQEKLKKMSPEELKEFQKQQCIFCKIAAGQVASKKIYEDDRCIAILDINPANPGHVLLMPKEHYAIMPMMPEELLGHLARIAKGLSHVLLNSLKTEGTNIFIANGTAAGQRSQHFMIHIIPRKENDKVGIEIVSGKFDEKKINEAAKAISDRISGKELAKAETKEEKKAEENRKEKEEAEEKGEEEKKEETKKEIGLDDIARLFK